MRIGGTCRVTESLTKPASERTGRDEAEAASGDLGVRMGLLYARQGESGERRGARERSGCCDAPRGCPLRSKGGIVNV